MLPDTNILDILISIVLIYPLLSVLVSRLIEWWNQKRSSRAKFLRQVILLLLKDPPNVLYGELFYSRYNSRLAKQGIKLSISTTEL